MGPMWCVLLVLVACAPDRVKALSDVKPGPNEPSVTQPVIPGDTDPRDTSEPLDTGEGGDTGDTGDSFEAVYGFIGSPCDSVADCPYDDAVCLSEADGYPGGMCSLACASSCPDEAGYPVTGCVDDSEIPAGAVGEAGSCFARCDFALYGEGCRTGYGCRLAGRPEADQTDIYACLPGDETSDLGSCREDLAARGIGFTPVIMEDDHPSDVPSLTCHLEDPVWLLTPVAGVDLRYYDAEEPDWVTVDCETAHAIADSAEDVGPLGVAEIVHVGAYNCRTISGTTTLSQHGLGRALDINGFIFDDGTYITVLDHWEDGDSTPESWEGQFLYEAVHRWYDDWIWNIILTPEYNDAHDNHFHVDLTEGSHTLAFTDDTPRYLGPPPDGHMD